MSDRRSRPPRSTRNTPEAIDQRKRQLLARDPIRTRLTDAFLALVEAGPGSAENAHRSRAVADLRDQIQRKYGIPIYLPEPASLAALPAQDRRELAWCAVRGRGADPVQVSRNWGWPVGFWLRGRLPAPDVRAGEPHRLTITIDVEQVGRHDVKRIGSAIRAELHAALRDLPLALQGSPSRRDPRRLGFLSRMTDAAFRQHLRRYDLWLRGLSFRAIAELERAERRGRRMPDEPQARRVGLPVRGEDAVKKAVTRLFAAIHDKPYSSRRAARQALTDDEERFSCSTHPDGSCDLRCATLQRFMQRFNARHAAPR